MEVTFYYISHFKSIKYIKIIFFSIIVYLFSPFQADAFSLEDINLKSSFGEKFHAEIIVSNDAKKGLKVILGSPYDYALLGVRRSNILDDLHIVEPIEFVSIDQQIINIVSNKPLFYPSFDLIIKATLDDGTILRKYSLLVDFKKNMSLTLSPPKPKEKEISKPQKKLPEVITKRKEKKPVPLLKEMIPDKPEIIVKNEIKKIAVIKKPNDAKEKKAEKKKSEIPETVIEEQKKPIEIKKSKNEDIVKKQEKPKKIDRANKKQIIKEAKKASTIVKKPALTKKKELSSQEIIPAGNLPTYKVAPGDSLSKILKKVKPNITNLYRAVVALWKLNKKHFLDNNINALKIGAQLSFDNLEKEIRKTTNKETNRVLHKHWVQWKNIQDGAGKVVKEEVSEIPLPGENLTATNDIERILSEWERSWEEKDLDKHFSYYSKDFVSHNYRETNVDLAGWKKYKSRITEKNENIKIDVKSLQIRREGNLIIASFLQNYSSDSFISFGTKTITFEQKDKEWKIKKEIYRKENSGIIFKKYPYVVRTSSHRNWVLAVKAANRLRKAGFAAYLVKSADQGIGLRFFVVIDRFRTKREANILARRLIKGKFSKHASVLRLPYAISISSFTNDAEAYKTLQDYRRKRYSPYLLSIREGNEIIHHVLVGGYKNMEQVKQVSKILDDKGVKHKIIQP